MRSLPELLLLRHGETEWNREGRFQGVFDSPLTQRGRAQAFALGALLAAQGALPATHEALGSPQGRARETATIALRPLGFAVHEDARLAEIGMGEWAGLTRAEIALRWPGPSDEDTLELYGRCPGGEGFAAVATRIRSVLAELRRPAVIVSHGLTLRVLCAEALGAPLVEVPEIGQGSLIRLRDGRMDVLEPDAPGLPAREPGGMPALTGG